MYISEQEVVGMSEDKMEGVLVIWADAPKSITQDDLEVIRDSVLHVEVILDVKLETQDWGESSPYEWRKPILEHI